MFSCYGNFYVYNIFDVYCDMLFDFGVIGVLEYFVIDVEGIICMYYIGDINECVWNFKVGLLYNKLVVEVFGKIGNGKKVDVDVVMVLEFILLNMFNEKNN